MKKSATHRDLSRIRGSASTARVINLPAISERYGSDEDFASKPFFKSRRLNETAIIVKHALRSNEMDYFEHKRTSATKIILPYSRRELALGGISCFVNERTYRKFLDDVVGDFRSKEDDAADRQLLEILDQLPSFDPFLLRERLRLAGVVPARQYFDIADADIDRMRAYVCAEFAKLIELAMAKEGVAAKPLAQRLADKLMVDETAAALAPLRETLRLSGQEYSEGVFAWKGFLYYHWLLDELKASVEAFSKSVRSCHYADLGADERRSLKASIERIERLISAALAGLSASLLDYTEAYGELLDGRANAFRDFLLTAPDRFIPIGESVGMLRHITSFWEFYVPKTDPRIVSGREALSLFSEFLLGLDSADAGREGFFGASALTLN